jgi:hypothetical protein
LWTERLLATLPKGVAPRPADWYSSWIAVTADLSTFAYAARFVSGDRWREAIVVGDERGPTFMDVRFPALSPDGTRVAYIGVTPDEGLPAFLVLGIRACSSDSRTNLGDPWTPVFSRQARSPSLPSAGKRCRVIVEQGRSPHR